MSLTSGKVRHLVQSWEHAANNAEALGGEENLSMARTFRACAESVRNAAGVDPGLPPRRHGR